MRLQAKVCGLTCEQDLRVAEAAGADWFGFVHCADSPRHCTALDTLAAKAGARGVLVMVADSVGAVMDVAETCGLRTVQPYLPEAVRAAAVGQLRAQGFQVFLPWPDMPDQPAIEADLYVWETPRQATGVHGGSGVAHDGAHPPPGRFLLAGGIDAGTLHARAAALPARYKDRLAGFDAASRLEYAPGRKSAEAVNAFVSKVHAHVI